MKKPMLDRAPSSEIRLLPLRFSTPIRGHSPSFASSVEAHEWRIGSVFVSIREIAIRLHATVANQSPYS